MRIAKSLLQPRPSRASAEAPAPAPAKVARPSRPAALEVDPVLLEMYELVKAGQPEAAVEVGVASLQEGHGAPLLELARHCAGTRRPQLALDLLGIVGSVRPDLLAPLAADERFVALRDDPRFLQMTGGL